MYHNILFNEAFLDKNTDWKDVQELRRNRGNDTRIPWIVPNRFEVCYFPSSIVVLFTVDSVYKCDGELYHTLDHCGARL